MVLLPERGLRLLVLMGEIVLPAGAEVNVPAPKTPEEGLGIIVVGCAELAVLARVGCLLCHKSDCDYSP